MSAPARSTSTLVEIEPEAWDALLEEHGVGDAYLRRDYVEASCLLDEGRPCFLHLAVPGGHVVLASIVRKIPGAEGRFDVTTPYGYGGPVAVGPEPPVEEFYEGYEDWCRESGIVSTFIRFHPLFGNHRQVPPGVPTERLADTATWSLDGRRDLFAEIHQMHRRGIRKALRAGLEVSIEAPPERLDDFVRLYDGAMRRRGAEGFYLFPEAYWDAVSSRLRDRLVRLDARDGDELVASMLLLANERGTAPAWLHYLLGAASERGFALGASKLLFLRAAEWGREAGFVELHLGSGLGAREDSLWEFKQRFSPDPGREFRVGKLVHDAEAYRSLAGVTSLDGFFPAYRARG